MEPSKLKHFGPAAYHWHRPCPVACSIREDTQATGHFLCKAAGVLAGVAIAGAVFAACDPSITVQWSRGDGDTVATGDVCGTVTGGARAVLRAERVALNFLQVCRLASDRRQANNSFHFGGP